MHSSETRLWPPGWPQAIRTSGMDVFCAWHVRIREQSSRTVEHARREARGEVKVAFAKLRRLGMGVERHHDLIRFC